MAIEHLTSLEQLEQCIQASFAQVVLLFKHSTRCPVSTAADNNFHKFAESEMAERLRLVHLDLIAHRDISNAIATKTGIAHQSPQAIYLIDGKAVWHKSHLAITPEELTRGLEAIA